MQSSKYEQLQQRWYVFGVRAAVPQCCCVQQKVQDPAVACAAAAAGKLVLWQQHILSLFQDIGLQTQPSNCCEQMQQIWYVKRSRVCLASKVDSPR